MPPHTARPARGVACWFVRHRLRPDLRAAAQHTGAQSRGRRARAA